MTDSYFHHDWYVETRDRLAEAQNWRCCYCGVLMNRWRQVPTRCTIEHVIPVSAGGRLDWETCAAACEKCNREDGYRLMLEGRLPLTVPLCPWCGTDQLRLGKRWVGCDLCSRRFADAAIGLPFYGVQFRALRRVAGEMIVSAPSSAKIAIHLQHQILHVGFFPLEFTEAMMRLATDPINAARLKSDSLTEIYAETVNTLRKNYTPKMPAAPERGPLGKRLMV